MTDPIIFEGAQVILPDRIAEVSVRIEGGLITALDGPRDGARVATIGCSCSSLSL